MRATIEETTLPDLYKVLALRENLTEDTQKRMANLFNGSYTYAQAWSELKDKYGVPALIIQAHIQHLQMVQSFRNGDFKSLADLASLVRDAVSSVAGDPSMNEFTHSTVVNQLATKLPFNLQQDWGRYAYNLRPKVSSLADFDRWIDAIVGAEELRGAKLNNYVTPKQNPPPRPALPFPPTILKNSVAFKIPNSVESPSERPNRADNQWPACPACSDNPGHRLEACGIFRKMLPSQRAALCGENNHCFKCLLPGHYGRSCRNTDVACNACPGKHHSLIHGAERVFPGKPQPKGKATLQILLVHAPKTSPKPVLLAITTIVVYSDKETILTFGVLDPGSEATLIKSSLAQRLRLKGANQKIRFGSFHNAVLLDSADKARTFQVTDAFTVPDIQLSPRNINWHTEKFEWPHLSDLNLPPIDSSKVELLIGIDIVDAHEILDSRISSHNEPRPNLTVFGWAVVGKIPPSLIRGPSAKRSVNVNGISPTLQLIDLVQKFYSTETFGVDIQATKPSSPEDALAISILKSSILNIRCGWQVDLLFKSPNPNMPNNRAHAVSRFYAVERRLLSQENKVNAIRYREIIEGHLANGYAIEVPYDQLQLPFGKVWYLPHHFVVTNPNKPNKIRVVFYCSAKFNNVCLNDFLLRGPVLLSNLTGVLLRSRQYLVAVSADIESMYHRVGVTPKDQSALRFVWRTPGSDEPLPTLQMTTQVFGAISSSFWVLQHAVNSNSQFPAVAKKLVDNFYADNLSDSFETEEEAILFSKQAVKSLASGGFRLTAFASSSRRLLASIPPSERSSHSI
ncbi:uncharacterized protein LOC124342113 [Daphnia pulicaria]|uniref:uncharacterized protein LOC124342113 n=1 Tax=Daphnia pulicaria TaxID=35523 RepID=UPI001EEA84F8|nr:uncharacterized protein LOC124342113 [Daphnia pulicaria]